VDQTGIITTKPFGAHALTQASTSSEQPNAKSQIDPETKKIIAKLGLRYRPAAAADLEAHAHLIGLLTTDVAHLSPSVLDQATRQWVSAKAFMPKASELLALASEIMKRRINEDREHRPGETSWSRANRLLEAEGRSVRWIGGNLIEPSKPMNSAPLSIAEIEALRDGTELQRGVFDMGVSKGWLVQMNDGRYCEPDVLDLPDF